MAELSEEELKTLNRARSALEKYDFIKFTIIDINGISRTKVMVADEECLINGTNGYAVMVGVPVTAEGFVHHRLPASSSPVAGLRDGNIHIMPQLETLRPVHTNTDEPYTIGEVACEMKYYSPGGLIPQPSCPRYAARNMVGKLKELGYDLMSGYEAEFQVYDETSMEPLTDHVKFCGTDKSLVTHQRLLMGIAHECRKNNVKLAAFHKEYDAGQLEYITRPLYGVEAADNLQALKDTSRAVCQRHGKLATYMSVPFPHTASGLHFSVSLWKDGHNAFYDAEKADKLSDLCRYWMAGVLKHLPALTALCAPTVNCYRRFGCPFCPGTTNWGIDDRAVTIRAKAVSPSSCLVENRIPSSSANPYIVMAATIAAGVDGIVNKLDCQPSNADGCSGEKLPATLGTALEALKQDNTMRDQLGPELVDWFVLLKEFEISRLGGYPPSSRPDTDQLAEERKVYMDLI